MGAHGVYASPLTLNVSQPPFMPAQMTLTSTCAARERSPGSSSKASPHSVSDQMAADDYDRSLQAWQCLPFIIQVEP